MIRQERSPSFPVNWLFSKETWAMAQAQFLWKLSEWENLKNTPSWMSPASPQEPITTTPPNIFPRPQF
jgi:hypothetical protein